MSISFHVRCPAPDVQVLAVAQLALIDVDPPTGRWPDGRVLHGYLPGVSTRCIVFCWRDGMFEARILALSCPEDHQAAQRVVRRLAADAGTQVTCEDGGTYDPHDPAAYGPDWLEPHLRAEIDAVIEMARTRDEPLEVLGLHRPWAMDRAFAETLAALDPESRTRTLFTTLRAAVQPVPTGSEPPSVETVPTPEADPAPTPEGPPGFLAPRTDVGPVSLSDEPTEEVRVTSRTPTAPPPVEPPPAAPPPVEPPPAAPPARDIPPSAPAPVTAPGDLTDQPAAGPSPLVMIGAAAVLVAVLVGAWMTLT